MRKSLMVAIAALVFEAPMLLACSEDSSSPADVANDVSNDADVGQAIDTVETRVTWDNAIASTLNISCARCHSWIGDYDRVVSDLEGLKSLIATGHGKLSTANLAKVLAWIDDGAPKEE